MKDETKKGKVKAISQDRTGKGNADNFRLQGNPDQMLYHLCYDYWAHCAPALAKELRNAYTKLVEQHLVEHLRIRLREPERKKHYLDWLCDNEHGVKPTKFGDAWRFLHANIPELRAELDAVGEPISAEEQARLESDRQAVANATIPPKDAVVWTKEEAAKLVQCPGRRGH